MAGEGIITITGNVGADAQLNVTSNGGSVASFSLANTPRVKKNDEWTDGETVWFRCAVWGKEAENVATQVKKGMRVIVTGRLNIITHEEKLQINITVDEYGIKPKTVINNATSNDTVANDPWA